MTPLAPSAEAPPLTDPAVAEPRALAFAADPTGVVGFANKPVHNFGATLTGAGAASGFASGCSFSSDGAVVAVGLSDADVFPVCFCSGDISSAVGVILTSFVLAFGITGTTGTAGTAAREEDLVDLVGVALATVLL